MLSSSSGRTTNGGRGQNSYQYSSYSVDSDEMTPLANNMSNNPAAAAGTLKTAVPFRDRKPKEPPKRSRRTSCLAWLSIVAALLALILCGCVLGIMISGWFGKSEDMSNSSTITMPSSKSSVRAASPTSPTPLIDAGAVIDGSQTPAALFDEVGRYVITNYDALPPFSDFLPAVAGYYGKPLYAFYINRGQAMASFGVRDKNHSILEFVSANKAYQQSALKGFRTFVQGTRGAGKNAKSFLTEPFSSLNTRFAGVEDVNTLPFRTMFLGSNELQLQERDAAHGVEVNVTYFILPEEDFGAFVKRTTITNIQKDSTLTLSLLDGLAQLEPAGGDLNDLLKNMGRTLEGWMNVYSPYNGTYQMPFFRLSTQPADTASVVVQESGHYVLAVLEDDDHSTLLDVVYDTQQVFGEDTALLRPVGLIQQSIDDIVRGRQYAAARTPSAFAALTQQTLKPGQSVTISTFYGQAAHVLDVPVIARTVLGQGFCQYKASRTREVMKQITAAVETSTSNVLWNAHVSQMFLDNSLRGGIPSILGDVDDDARMRNMDEDPRIKVYHLFSRVHGDLERDYNDYVIEPSFFSQGPGNFRDVVQNRRNDVVLNPRIGSFNIYSTLSLFQADGYNPLKIEAVVFTIKDLNKCSEIAIRAVGRADGHRAQREALAGILNSGPFRPGQLFLLIEEQNIELILPRQEFIDMVAAEADTHPMAAFEKGFWADHWTYLMEHIEAYLAIYPDWEERIMFDQHLPFFFSTAFVKPRTEKYVLSTTFDGTGKHVRQLDATEEDNAEKQYQLRFVDNSTNWYNLSAHWQHDDAGEIFTVTPIAKLFLLSTIKYATRDAYGMGIEYEGGRPGWDDANNGLVGMLGSGMPETYELLVLLRYVRSLVNRVRRPLRVPAEAITLIDAINGAMGVLLHKRKVADLDSMPRNVPKHLFEYWDTVATAREQYRENIKCTFTGKKVEISADDLIFMIDNWIQAVEEGIQRAMAFGTQGFGDDGTTGITPTYFSYRVTDWALTGKVNVEGHALVRPLAMAVDLFPLFLEGPVRQLKTVPTKSSATKIYRKVKDSPLRDTKLQMYKISASLRGQSVDMGREMAFSPGWLENESIWTHMSYKYYLQLLKHDLFDDFYSEMTSGGMLPFMDASVYGRSLLECSSFIASSAFQDPSVQGRGFLPRLSGSTAEFLSMWVLIMMGPRPFFFQNGEMRFQLVPALPRWMFSDANDQIAVHSGDGNAPIVQFKLFGSIDVTYVHNRGQEDLYRRLPSRYVITLRDGNTFDVHDASVASDLADKIRRIVFVASIDVYFETG